jgi:hypothetical protein
MANVFEKKLEEQNPAQAPTLGMGSGTFGQQAQQRTNIAQGGSGRFTNLQQYIKANESNPNAQLLQREGTRRQEELGTRQQEFTRQAEPIKQQFEGIRSGQQFVQNALQNPTGIVQDPSQLQRFTKYRTQGIGDVEAPFQQLQTARGTLGSQQEQLASGLETIQRDPNALQNFIQSQRANPALATRGENVLDRFLTQSTESGQKAIAGLGTTAGAIRGSQAPSIIQDVESLRTQTQGQPLTAGEVQNVLTGVVTPEEEFIRGINPEFVAKNIGVNPEEAKTIVGQINKSKENQANLQKLIATANKEINNLDNAINFEKSIINDPIAQGWQKDSARKNLERYNRELSERRESLKPLEFDLDAQQRFLSDYQTRNQDIVNRYNNYLNRLNDTRESVIGSFDPTRLSRIQALQQLTGSTPFTPLLQQRLA